MNRTTRLKKPQIPELDTLYQFDDLGGRPKYGGVEMTSETDIPSFQEIMDETHSAVVAEATARDDADDALQAQIDSLDSDLTAETTAREAADQAEATARAAADQAETTARTSADNNLQTQIDAIVASSDVKDIVGTYAELQAYDTSTLGDNDIIKVLQDETHQDETTYYRWVLADEEFSLIGEEGPYYTKAATDALLNGKADKATTYTKTETDAALALKADKATTYTKTEVDTALAGKQNTLTFDSTPKASSTNPVTSEGIKAYVDALPTGGVTELTSADYNYPTDNPASVALWLLEPGLYSWGENMIVRYHSNDYASTPGIAWVWESNSGFTQILIFSNNNVKFLTKVKSTDGSVASLAYPIDLASPVVQTTGTSTTDVMSQGATTKMVYRDSAKHLVDIGFRNATQSFAGSDGVAIGRIDTGWTVADHGVILSSEGAYVRGKGGVAIGAGAIATQQGEMNVGSRYSIFGYNNSNYRLLTGLYDPQNDHDAATKGYVDTAVAGAGASYYSNSELESLWEGGV